MLVEITVIKSRPDDSEETKREEKKKKKKEKNIIFTRPYVFWVGRKRSTATKGTNESVMVLDTLVLFCS